MATEIVRDVRGNVERRVQLVENTGDAETNRYLVTKFAYDYKDRRTHTSVPFEAEGDDNRFSEGLDWVTDPNTQGFDASQWQTISVFDSQGHLVSATDALGNSSKFENFDDRGNPGRITDPLGNVTINVFDEGQLTSTIDAAGGETLFSYDFQGNLQTVVRFDDEGDATATAFGYDELGRLTETVGPDNQVRYFVYDDRDNQTLSYTHWEDPNDVNNDITLVTRTDYDENDRVAGTAQYTLEGEHYFASSSDLTETADWTTLTQYDDLGRVERTVDRFGTETWSTYDIRGNVVETRTASKDIGGQSNWIITRTLYDEVGRAYFTADAYAVLQSSYADVGQAALGTFTEFDALGRVIRTARYADVAVDLDPYAGEVKNSATSFNFGTATPMLENLTYYDEVGRVEFTVDAAGLIAQLQYDEAGRQKYVTQYLTGTLNVGTREVEGIVNSATDVLTTETTYDAAGRVETTIDAKGVVTRFIYDAIGRVTRTVADEGGLNVTTATQYDKLGRRTVEIDPLGLRTEYKYDELGRLTEVWLPQITSSATGSTTGMAKYQYSYDVYGNQTLIRDPMDNLFGGPDNKETTFTYDHFGRQTKRTLPDGLFETMTYSDVSLNGLATPESSVAAGQLEYVEDFEGRVTAYRYDNTPGAGGRIVEKLFYSDLGTYEADKGDGLLTQSLGSVTYFYSELNRLVWSDNVLTIYDVEGRVESIYSPQGELHYEYDTLGRLIRTYTGDLDVLHDSTNDDDKAVTDTRYTYDRLGRLKTVDVVERFDAPVTEIPTTYIYDKNGNLDRVDLPNGVISDYVYDNLNRLDLLTTFKDNDADKSHDVGEPLLGQYDYTVRADGKRTRVMETNDQSNTTTIDWIYDELGRLAEERFDHSVGTANDFITRYGFDLASNRVLMEKDTSNANPANFTVDESTEYTYDQNDRLLREQKDIQGTTVGDTTTFYQYGGPTNTATQQTAQNVYGGLISAPSGSRTSYTTYSYDVRGRLAQVVVDTNGDTAGGQTTTTYKYNQDGIRVSQTENGTTTIFHVDPNNHTGYAQVIEEGVELGTPDGKLQVGEIDKTYTLGLDVISQADSSAVYHFLYDGHESTRALLNVAAAVAERYAYDAYGNMQALGGYTADASTALTSLLYSGEKTDKTGLQYLRARYYDPAIGRFNRLDPFAGNTDDPLSLHKYLYGNGDPVQFVDPSGQFSLIGTTAASSIRNVLVGLEVAVFASVNATVEGARAGLDAHQIFIGLVLDDVLATVDIVVYLVSYALNVIESGVNFVVGKDGQLRDADGIAEASLGSFLFAKYSSLRRPSAIYQRNHLNTDAAWGTSRGGPITYGEGASVTLQGSKNQVGSEHFSFHLEMERFYDRHRKLAKPPTTDEYNRALHGALEAAGATGSQAKALVNYAKSQQLQFGYSGKRPIPRLPGVDSFLKSFL